jgi:hypothetical protein|tara:strand:- start:302 stop:535 length:234 start_codon:yes stop_codon:yes gene_type:complete
MAILPGQNYYNDPLTGKSYPSGSGGYSGGDGQVVHFVGTGAEITGSANPQKGDSGFNSDNNHLYVYNGTAWKDATTP